MYYYDENVQEIWWIVFGCCSALVVGSVEPILAISFSDYIVAFSKYEYGSVKSISIIRYGESI